jgi:predicted  nucleic acid-binding Zn-ribbon protein
VPIVTTEDEKLLSNLEIEVAHMLKQMSSKENSISHAEKKLADQYGDYTRFMGIFVRKLRDLSKQLEILSRAERSGITKDEVEDNKEYVRHLDNAIELKEKYSDKLKDVSIQKKSLLEKRIEYADIMIDIARVRKRVVDAGLKIESAKNKMVAAEKIASTESNLKDLEREYTRKKKDLQKKAEQLEKERDEVNEMWEQLKNVTKGME